MFIKHVALLSLLGLIPGIILSGVSGLGFLALIYVPGNTILLLVILTTIFVFAQNRWQLGLTAGFLWIAISLVMIFGIMIIFDTVFFNSHIPISGLLKKDYLPWIPAFSVMSLSIPVFQKLIAPRLQ